MKKINLIQTGGTISMSMDIAGAELDHSKWTSLLLAEIPELSSIAELTINKVFFEDSSDINYNHWQLISEHITANYDKFDGFVILHGTDTMAYTASALSFAFQNLGKPVIFTGSQVPMSNIRSDARRNLVNAVELATHPICEVAICFNDHLFRANRSTKMSIGDFDAFASPNLPPIAEIGIEIQLNHNYDNPEAPFSSDNTFDDSVFVLKLHPNLNPAWLLKLPLEQMKVIILEAFGSGNFPMKGDYNLLPFIRKCLDNHCEVIITSQAAYDAVDLNLYSSGREAKTLGAISAGDMTAESAVTKAMHLLGAGFSGPEFRKAYEKPLRGEKSI